MAECDALLTEYKRRDFLRILGSGALLALPLRSAERAVRVRLGEGGIYEAFTGKVEMGQGARTLLTQAVAEELGVPVKQVRMIMADTDIVPDDGGTWASLTTPETVPAIRTETAAIAGRPAAGLRDLCYTFDHGQRAHPAAGRPVGGALPPLEDSRTARLRLGRARRGAARQRHRPDGRI